MAGNVATATADADAESASLLPRASTVGATSRRGGRTVAVVAAVTAVAAVSLGGISGSPHLAARLGAVGARPRGADALIGHRPGEDLWDMIDRGLTEQKVRGAAGVTASERAERASSLGSVEGGPLSKRERPTFDAVTEAALARMPRGQRQEARAELRREAREAEHAKHVAERSAERRAKREELSRDDRRRARAESRAGLGGAAGSPSPSRSDPVASIDTDTPDTRSETPEHRAIPAADERDVMRPDASRANDALNDATTRERKARDDDETASYEAYDDSAYEPAGETETRVSHENAVSDANDAVNGDTNANANNATAASADISALLEGSYDSEAPVPDRDPNKMAARKEKRARERLEAEAVEEASRLRDELDEVTEAVTSESARLDDRRDELRETIHETENSREFRQEAAEEALAAALDGVVDDVVESSGFDQPGNRSSAETMDGTVASFPVDPVLLKREERVVESPEALQRELESLSDELATLQTDVPDGAVVAAQALAVNATASALNAEFASDNMVDGMPPTEEERLALAAAAEAVRANATATEAAHAAQRAAAVVRAEERARAQRGTEAVPQDTFRDSLVGSRQALRVSLRMEEQAAEANAAALEARRVAEDAAAEQELAVLQAQLERVRVEEERAEKREARVEARVEARRASEDAEAPGPVLGPDGDEASLLVSDVSNEREDEDEDEGGAYLVSAAPEVSPLFEENADATRPTPPTPPTPPNPSSPPPVPSQPSPPVPSQPSPPPRPPPFTRADFLRAQRVQAAYASEITTDADYAYEDARYEDAVAEAEDMDEEIAAAREMAYASETFLTSKNANDDDESAKSDDDDDDAFRVAWSGAAAATARVGSAREPFPEEGFRSPELSEKRFPESSRARARRQRRRQLRRRDAAGASLDASAGADDPSDASDVASARVDLNGWALDDSSSARFDDSGDAPGRLGSRSRANRASTATETSVETTQAVDALAERASAESSRTAKQSLEDILGAKLDAEASRPADVARAGRVYGGAAATGHSVSENRDQKRDGVARVDVHSMHNAFGAIPGLLEHVRAAAGPPPKSLGAARDLTARSLRMVTYANSKYWPVAKVFLRSLARAAPQSLEAMTVMLTDARDHAECLTFAAKLGHSCFLDEDMTRVLGEYAEAEGSQAAGERGAENESKESEVAKALRVAWCWRKVHAVYTLVRGGYPAVFLDASTVALADPRAHVASRLARAELVTLADFGGAKEQQAINTGVLAAAPDSFPVMTDASDSSARGGGLPSLRERRTVRLMEEWMAYEPDATDTEQAYLTWELAPVARARGDVIVALPHDRFPSYVTFDEDVHVRGGGDALAPIGRDRSGIEPESNDDSVGGVTVHAAYCGSVSGKLSFLRRVEALARDPSGLAEAPDADELAGCDAYDKNKFRACGNAPWDGDCD